MSIVQWYVKWFDMLGLEACLRCHRQSIPEAFPRQEIDKKSTVMIKPLLALEYSPYYIGQCEET